MTTTAVALDVKGHVGLLGPASPGERTVGFVLRCGDQLRLRATDPEVIVRLESALHDGTCLEILYEDKPDGPYDGILFHVC